MKLKEKGDRKRITWMGDLRRWHRHIKKKTTQEGRNIKAGVGQDDRQTLNLKNGIMPSDKYKYFHRIG